MKEDKLIELGFDGLTPEVVAMSDEQRAEVAANHSLKEALLSLKESVPEPQISFERVKLAIERDPAPTAGFRLWPALSGLATACVAVAGIFYLVQNNSTNQSVVLETDANSTTEVAMNLPEEVGSSSGLDMTAPFVIPEESAVEETVPTPVVEPQQNTRRSTPRRSRPAPQQASDGMLEGEMLVASNTSPAAYSMVSNVADMASNQRLNEISSGASRGTNSDVSSEPIVVVQTGQDPMTGSTPATEVRSPQSVVLGG